MEGNKKPPTSPFSTAIRLLARRPYAVAEMRRALLKQFSDEAEVGAAVARLREAGYLDDRKFARQFASFLVRNRALGRERVRLELKSRLVDYRFIEEAIEQAFEETSEQVLLERALEKKLRTVPLPLTQRKFYSLAKGMMRLGFRSDAIMKVMRSRPELKPVPEKVDPLSD
ncbi:MAG: regulatory protein RecX [Terriglobia bacterium]